MLTEFGSFCDEFGNPKDEKEKFFGIAGLLGWSDKWTAFDKEWNELFDKEQIPKPFHMVDFVHHAVNFSDRRWEDIQERKRILSLLLTVIEKAEVIPIGVSIVREDFAALTDAQKSFLGDNAYYPVFQKVSSKLVQAALHTAVNIAIRDENETIDVSKVSVHMVYARLKKFTGKAGLVWDDIKNSTVIGRFMSSCTIGEPLDHPPLQAADIGAYPLRRYGEQFPEKEEARMSFDFFANMANKSAELHGQQFFTMLDRNQLLIRCGEYQ